MWAEVIYGLSQASLHTDNAVALESISPEGVGEGARQCCPFAALISCPLTSSDQQMASCSPLFTNTKLMRRAPLSVARRAMFLAATELYPDFCLTNVTSAGSAPTQVPGTTLTVDGKNPWLLVLLGKCESGQRATAAPVAGANPADDPLDAFSLRSLRSRLMQWVLEEGGGYTLPNLVTKGVVATFEELVDGDVLRYGLNKATLSRVSSSHAEAVARSVPVGPAAAAHVAPVLPSAPRSATAVPYETVLRLLIDRQLGHHSGPSHDVSTNPLSAVNVELFNLDGSATAPFEGVKFGGQ